MESFYFKMNDKRISFFIKELFFLSILTVIFIQNVYAQCDLKRDKDNYSTTEIVSTKDVKIAGAFPLVGTKKPWDLVISFFIGNGTYGISLTHSSQKYASEISSISFKFEDEIVIQKDENATTGNYDNGFGVNYTFTTFLITKEELKTFATKDLLKFKVVFSFFDDYPVIDEDLKKKDISQIKSDVACLLLEINPSNEIKETPMNDFSDECKYDKDKVDDFTKKRDVITKPAIIYDIKIPNFGQNFLNVTGNNTNGVNGLGFNRGVIFNGNGNLDESKIQKLLQFDQIDLLLENEEIISLKDTETSKYFNRGSTFLMYKVFAIENDSIWNIIKLTPVKKVRISMNGTESDTQEIESSKAKSNMKVINCIDILAIPKPK